MVTPVEAHAGKKAFDWIKGASTYLWRLGKRIATLEERITALEQQLKTAPADACPYCGERAMRLAKQHYMVKGDHPKRWTEEDWICGSCTQKYTKKVPI
jgi:DNA-directed RNA polymerase subunit RPC12/RpoP